MAKVTKPPINYTSRDFDTIKSDLVSYIKRYYPDTFKDFQEAGVGSMMLDTVAYVGDILSFYLDYQVNESFLETASEFDNVVKIAQQLGLKYQPNKTATGIVSFFIAVPASTSPSFESGASPDLNYAPVLKKGATMVSTSGVPFILTTDVDFADSRNEVTVLNENPTSGQPTKYAIRAYGRAVSGRLKTATRAIGSFKPFQKVFINDNSIIEVISVTDSNNNKYYEVPNIAQDVIFRQVPNNGTDKAFVKFLLQPKSTPRRFQVLREAARAVLQFGYGSEEDIETAEKNVMPSRVTMDMFAKDYVTDSSFDPNTLLKSGKFGVAPADTTLRIVYRTNATSNVNISSESLNTITRSRFVFSDLATSNTLKDQVRTSIEATNESPINGDLTPMSAADIKVLAANSLFAQNRAVTANDYKTLCYSMPASFGGVKRVAVYKDVASLKNNINIFVLAEDQNNKFTTPTTSLRNNLKTWLARHKLLSDSIDIFDAKIINTKIDFTAISEDGADKTATLARAERSLRKYLTENPNNIGEPLYITRLINAVNEADGVADVISLNVSSKTGTKYSSVAFDLNANISADGRKVYIPKNVIWEVKFPFQDINGEMR